MVPTTKFSIACAKYLWSKNTKINIKIHRTITVPVVPHECETW